MAKKNLLDEMQQSINKVLERPVARPEKARTSRAILEEFKPPQSKTEPESNSTQLDSTRLNSTHISPKTETPVAPQRDFNRRPNSLEREALPQGLFPGTSKKLYDALYLRTRGAVKPVRSIKAKRSEVMRWAGIGGLNTFLSHIKHLTRVGLIVRTFDVGDKEGAIYEVRIPEELDSTQLNSTQLNSTQDNSPQNLVPDSTQKLMRVESSQTIDSSVGSAKLKTPLKTTTNDDEKAVALSDLNNIFAEATRKLTGREPKASEREQWAELARVLVTELNKAAARAGSVSSVPAFLTAHLKRRLAQKPVMRKREGKQTAPASETSTPAAVPASDQRLSPEDMESFTATVRDHLMDGKTIEEVEAQFAAGLHPEDWQKIREAALSQEGSITD